MLKTDVAELLLKKYGKQNPPTVKPGDTVKVHQKIKEGDKERVQIFEGLVIAMKHGKGLNGTFTVRKIATGGIGVERTYPLHSPNVVKVERTKSAKVARAKLYYMRDRKGKTARFKHEGPNAAMWEEPAFVAPVEVENEIAEEAVENIIELHEEIIVAKEEGTPEGEVMASSDVEPVTTEALEAPLEQTPEGQAEEEAK
jgi:large subunit ribosomal protein L19